MAESPSELQAEIEKLETRHAENPQGRFFVPLANAYRKSGEVEQAEALLRAGLRQHPDYLSAHIVLGRCLADRGAMSEAASEFEYVLSVDPQNLIALRTLGELAAADGRGDEASRWYEELLAVDPMNEDARRALDTLEQPRPAAAAVDAPEVPPPDRAPATAQPGALLALDDEEEGSMDEGLEAGGEVVTETIAELYARQGLHDRAAGVYRELIRRRGGDPALERRLAELTALAAEPALAPEREPEPAPGSEQAPDSAPPADDPFAASFEHGFAELPTLGSPEPELPAREAEPEPVVEPAPTAEHWPEVAAATQPDAAPEPEPEPEPVAAAATIAEYLVALATWRPGTAAPMGWATPSPEPAPLPSLEPAPVHEPEPGVDAIPDLPSFDEDPWTSGLVLDPADDPIPGLTRASDGAAEVADEVSFPWELPEDAPAPAAEEEPASPEELFSFDSFFSDPESAVPPAPVEPAPPPPVPPATPSAEPAPAEPSPAPGQDEEDDLESFQAWLRSLKR